MKPWEYVFINECSVFMSLSYLYIFANQECVLLHDFSSGNMDRHDLDMITGE